MGRDYVSVSLRRLLHYFNPRAPHGARRNNQQVYRSANQFQSTRPAWGATYKLSIMGVSSVYFNPRAPHGARHIIIGHNGARLIDFNPRAPHGARRIVEHNGSVRNKFQSTRPAWGATKSIGAERQSGWISIHAPRMGRDFIFSLHSTLPIISIHAPRMGRDITVSALLNINNNFNPRAPHGARQQNCTKYLTYVAQFQQKIIYALF